MTNKEFHQLLTQAISGNVDALGDLLEMYLPLINRYSDIDGRLDEDLRQQIMLRVFKNIGRFRI